MSNRMMPMQDGPPIDWATAEKVYAAYAMLYGGSQSIERIAERGGFGWSEVAGMFDTVRRKDYALWLKLTGKK